MTDIARSIKRVIPRSLKSLWWAYTARRDQLELEQARSPEEIFSAVYKRGHWGKSSNPDQKYFSGSGSHDEYIVSTYVSAVREYIGSRHEILNAVDLGCGDFAVGSQLRGSFNRYTACDVVPDLIKHNAEKFKTLDVDFRQLDISKDPLPAGDIVFIRQVLQHLSNDRIQNILSKVKETYRFFVLTEHVPMLPHFAPNLDHTTGRDVRLGQSSGIVVTEPPFNLRPRSERVLCEVPEDSGPNKGVIRTIAYEL